MHKCELALSTLIGSYINFVLLKLSNDKEEYKTVMTTIDKVVQDHKSKMKRGTPQLNMCDNAVMVSSKACTQRLYKMD